MKKLEINIDTGLLNDVLFIPSPNFDERPLLGLIDLLIIHGISLPPGKFGGNAIVELFTNTLDPKVDPYFADVANLKVASHLLIRRTGEIIQFVPFNKRAWHAGVSEFQGRSNCNDFSIGIELEGTDEIPYEDIQYQQLAEVTRCLMQTYPAITKERIVGHSDVAPGRKTDPGVVFDWKRLYNSLD